MIGLGSDKKHSKVIYDLLCFATTRIFDALKERNGCFCWWIYWILLILHLICLKKKCPESILPSFPSRWFQKQKINIFNMTTLVCSWFKNKTIRSHLAPRRRSFCRCIFHLVVWWAVCTPSSCPWSERTSWGPWLWTPRAGNTWTHSSPPTWWIPPWRILDVMASHLNLFLRRPVMAAVDHHQYSFALQSNWHEAVL